ncbi:MAG: chromate efflux transporter [Terracidiphilus sp.]
MEVSDGKTPFGEILGFFLRLGLTAFGGPAAHIALMEREAVERRRWLSRERFLDLVGACNLLPGPSSTQVAMALGYTRRGWLGLAAAGACFILPASIAVLALAWAYVRYGGLPQTQGLLYGVKPVMVAIVAQAVWRLGRLALRGWALALAGVACFAAVALGAPPFSVLVASGGIALLVAWSRAPKGMALGIAWLPAGLGGGAGAAAAAGAGTAGSIGLGSIVLVFLKLGVVVFGSGYVLLEFLRADLVDRLHWITNAQLLDAVTAGQVTPGPVFTTATFLGYLLHGWSGAGLATLAIFLPSFLMAGAVGALAGKIRGSKLAAACLDGVNAAAVALMADVALALGRATLIDGWTWALALVSALLLLRFRVNATWLILGGAAIGIFLHVLS